MAAIAIESYSNAKTLLTFLAEEDLDSRRYALENLKDNIEYLWHELIDHIALL